MTPRGPVVTVSSLIGRSSAKTGRTDDLDESREQNQHNRPKLLFHHQHFPQSSAHETFNCLKRCCLLSTWKPHNPVNIWRDQFRLSSDTTALLNWHRHERRGNDSLQTQNRQNSHHYKSARNRIVYSKKSHLHRVDRVNVQGLICRSRKM